jgi:hypothetical protein
VAGGAPPAEAAPQGVKRPRFDDSGLPDAVKAALAQETPSAPKKRRIMTKRKVYVPVLDDPDLDWVATILGEGNETLNELKKQVCFLSVGFLFGLIVF